MKGKPPNKYFFHNGTKYILTGNERLAMSHFHEVRTHLDLLKMTNVHDLPIVFGTKEFDDGTTATFQLVHGIEQINIFAPIPIIEELEEPEILIEEKEDIIPCMVVTGDNSYSPPIIGYIACLSGSFLGPYKWFPADKNDSALVIEGFAPEGDSYNYVEELAFKNDKKLSTSEDGSELRYILPSATCPDNSQFVYPAPTTTGTIPEIFQGGYWTEFEDSEWVYTAAVGSTIMEGTVTIERTVTFDGQPLYEAFGNITSEYNTYAIWLYAASGCTYYDEEGYAYCVNTIEEFKSEIPMIPFVHAWNNTYELNESSTIWDIREYLLIGSLEKGVRTNDGSISNSAFLKVSNIEEGVYNGSNNTGIPTPYNNTFSTNPVNSVRTGIETNILYVVIDNEIEYNVSEFFGWDYMRDVYVDYDVDSTTNFDSIGWCANLVYHKGEKALKGISLSTAVAFPIDGYYGPGDIAYIYTGPAKDGVEGSVSFPVETADEAFIDIHEALPNIVPASVTGELRGHVFLGKIKSASREIKIR